VTSGTRIGNAASVAAGAVLLAWPALANGYPLVFSDTGAYLHQTLGPLAIWDKPHVYGPLLHAFHWRLTLWLPLAAQALMVAWVLFLCVRVVVGACPHPGPPPLRRGGRRSLPCERSERGRAGVGAITLALCAALALLTPAPFTVALLMPDAFAPALVLALFLLGLARDRITRAEAIALGIIATLAIASHLSHLPVAAALALLVLLWTRRWRDAVRVAAPITAAVAILLSTNLALHGRASLSPHGVTFLLARLQADGPAAATIRARCPGSGWYLCAFADRLPMDANDFLWDPASPVNRDGAGQPRFLGGAQISPEAAAIVAATLRDAPVAVVVAMARNTLRQLLLVQAGDTLGPDHLAGAVRPRIAEGFPARELAAYDAALQPRGALADAVASIIAPEGPVLLLSLLLAPLAWWRAGASPARALLACVLLGCLANAFATGALSGPHLRYGARIAWLLPFAVALALLPAARRPA